MINHIVLKDGRKLAYGVYGDPEGVPLLFFHGTPGTNILAKMAENEARKYGFRLIAPDRPGLGGSTFQPHRKLYHFAEDIRELLDQLQIDKIGIVAISGGSPYAFQCAHDLPDRIAFIASLSGWVSYGRPEARRVKISKPFRAFHWCTKYCEPAFHIIGGLLLRFLCKAPEKAVQHFIADLPQADQKILENARYRKILQEDLQNAFVQGWQGAAQEGKVQFSAPAFALKDVRQPVLLLHGTVDNIAPYGFVEILRDNLPQVVDFRTSEGGGHFCALNELDWVFDSLRKL